MPPDINSISPPSPNGTTSPTSASPIPPPQSHRRNSHTPTQGAHPTSPTIRRLSSSLTHHVPHASSSSPLPPTSTTPSGATVAATSAGPPERRPSQHGRQISLGELHQELESEQEAQVNRLLIQIRRQQEELLALQAQVQRGQSQGQGQGQGQSHGQGEGAEESAVADEGASPVAGRAAGGTAGVVEVGRRASSTSAVSPAAVAGPADPFSVSTRDKAAFYRAESQTLQRENLMLLNRVRDLERQLAEMNAPSSTLGEASGGGDGAV